MPEIEKRDPAPDPTTTNGPSAPDADSSPIPSSTVPLAIPPAAVTTTDGQEFVLSEALEGESRLVVFTASWVAPLGVEELRVYEAALQLTGIPAVFVTVQDQDPAQVEAMVADAGIVAPVLVLDGQMLLDELGILALPTTVLVASDGTIVANAVGIQELEPLVDFITAGLNGV